MKDRKLLTGMEGWDPQKGLTTRHDKKQTWKHDRAIITTKEEIDRDQPMEEGREK